MHILVLLRAGIEKKILMVFIITRTQNSCHKKKTPSYSGINLAFIGSAHKELQASVGCNQ